MGHRMINEEYLFNLNRVCNNVEFLRGMAIGTVTRLY